MQPPMAQGYRDYFAYIFLCYKPTILSKIMWTVSCKSYYTAISSFNTVPRSPFSMF